MSRFEVFAGAEETAAGDEEWTEPAADKEAVGGGIAAGAAAVAAAALAATGSGLAALAPEPPATYLPIRVSSSVVEKFALSM